MIRKKSFWSRTSWLLLFKSHDLRHNAATLSDRSWRVMMVVGGSWPFSKKYIMKIYILSSRQHVLGISICNKILCVFQVWIKTDLRTRYNCLTTPHTKMVGVGCKRLLLKEGRECSRFLRAHRVVYMDQLTFSSSLYSFTRENHDFTQFIKVCSDKKFPFNFKNALNCAIHSKTRYFQWFWSIIWLILTHVVLWCNDRTAGCQVKCCNDSLFAS